MTKQFLRVASPELTSKRQRREWCNSFHMPRQQQAGDRQEVRKTFRPVMQNQEQPSVAEAAKGDRSCNVDQLQMPFGCWNSGRIAVRATQQQQFQTGIRAHGRPNCSLAVSLSKHTSATIACRKLWSFVSFCRAANEGSQIAFAGSADAVERAACKTHCRYSTLYDSGSTTCFCLAFSPLLKQSDSFRLVSQAQRTGCTLRSTSAL